MERAGFEPAASDLQTQPIARPHLTPTDKTGMTEPNLALLSNVIRHGSTAVRSHRARTTAAWTGNDSGSQRRAWDRTDDLRRDRCDQTVSAGFIWPPKPHTHADLPHRSVAHLDGVFHLVAPGRFHHVSRATWAGPSILSGVTAPLPQGAAGTRDLRPCASAVARRSLYPTLQAKEPKPLRTPAGSWQVRLSGAWFPLRFHRTTAGQVHRRSCRRDCGRSQ
jgi:hypothetical protein